MIKRLFLSSSILSFVFLCACDSQGRETPASSASRPAKKPPRSWQVALYTDDMAAPAKKHLLAEGDFKKLFVAISCPSKNEKSDAPLGIRFAPLENYFDVGTRNSLEVSVQFDQGDRSIQSWHGAQNHIRIPYAESANFLSSMEIHREFLLAVHEANGEVREDTFSLTGFGEALRKFSAECQPVATE